MLRLRLALLGILVCGAGMVAAQAEPGPGDLIPRTGTLAYMTSDKPDVLYRMFGRDAQGGWKLRSFMKSQMDEEMAEAPAEEREESQAVFNFMFNGYEALAQIEIGLVDVTADGPKYLLHLKTKEGESIEIAPDFMSEFVEVEQTYKGVKYVLYRVGPEEETAEEGDTEGADEGDFKEERAQAALGESMNRFYVAKTSSGVLVSNFETTIRNSIDLLTSADYSEALSQRAEFKEWINSRTPHDFSIFIIGREIQRAIERAMPSEDQAGMDAEGVYRGIDDWLQFREYRYMVLDFDYDAAARGITVAGSFKTRRETRLLSKIAIEPAEFKLLKYAPEGPLFTAGVQLGDAKQTFENLKELAYDAEGWVKELEGGFGAPPDAQPWPEDEEAMPPEEDSEDDTGRMDSVMPGDALRILKNLQDMGEEDAGDPGTEGDPDDTEKSNVDETLEELKVMLSEYGTSLDEVLSTLGSEIVVFGHADADRAAEAAYDSPGMDDIMGSVDLGIAVAITDVEKAKGIIAAARESDPEGPFRGFTEVAYQGVTFNVSPDQPFGYAFTADALLVAVATGVSEKDVTDSIIATLRGMVEASTRTDTGGDSFIRNGSKFIEFDIGAMSRLEAELSEGHSKRLDRYAKPPLGVNPTSFMTDMTLALRTSEYKDGVEIAVRVAGLPDFGRMLESDASPFAGQSGERNAYTYAEENLRALGRAMRTRTELGEPIDLDAMLKADEIRTGHLQIPFDSRWEGDLESLGWITLDQVVRDAEGELPSWVEKESAEMIEANEKLGFTSVRLAEGDLADWITNYKAGFIVAWQNKPETLGGHFVLYADGQVGWLHADVLDDALALNKKGEPVPAEDAWEDEPGIAQPDDKPADDGERIDEADPWFPGGK